MVFNLVSREGAGGRRRRGGPRVARVPCRAAVTIACASCSAASSFWMPSRESIAPDAARFVDRRGSALGGRCASRCAVRKSGEPVGEGAATLSRGSSMDLLRAAFCRSSCSLESSPGMQRRDARSQPVRARVPSRGAGCGRAFRSTIEEKKFRTHHRRSQTPALIVFSFVRHKLMTKYSCPRPKVP